MLKLVLSLFGMVFGIILAYIAPEELKLGKKYFFIIKRIIFVLLFFLINYYFFIFNKYLSLVLFTTTAICLFVLELKFKKLYLYYEIGNYLIFMVSFFLIQDKTFQLILISLIFLYGLPAGIILQQDECVCSYIINKGIKQGNYKRWKKKQVRKD